ncbi:ribonuclease H-like domain-containing protein [Tanacetum coccineum]
MSALKLPILKTGDHDLWSMRMEQYLTHTNYTLWEVIMNGDAPAIASASTEGPIPPKTFEQKLARKNELKAKSILLLAIPNEYMLKFHGIKDAKSLWEAIKNRFEGNKESKKMQKTILKQTYENFAASSQEGLDKSLRSLPSAWNNIALIMRNKFDLDTLNNTSSTNEAVNTANDVFAASSQGQASFATYADDVMFSIFANQSNSPQLDNEDLEQIDTDDLKEMDLKSHVAMLTMRMKRFIKKTRRNMNFNGKETVGFDKTKVECYNCHRRGHFTRECRALRNQGNRNGDNTRRVVQVETPANALVIQDGICGYDWSFQAEEDHTNFALMAYTSQLENALKEKDDLKLKLENFDTSYKNLTKLMNSQISAKDKTGLGYNSHVNKSEVLDNVVDSVFDNPESDGDNNQVNDNDSVYKSKVSETITSKDSLDKTTSETSKDSLEKPKTVRPSAPIIED